MLNKKVRLRRLLKIWMVLLPAILMITCMPVSEFEGTRRIREFYLEEPHSLDVVMLGASDVYAGFSPVLAYDEFGFTSYDYVLSGNSISLFYPQLETVFETQSPELVIIDISEGANPGQTADFDRLFRQFLTGIPSLSVKNRLIRQWGNSSKLLAYYFPFIESHGNTDLPTVISNALSSYQSHKRGYSLLKGSVTCTRTGDYWTAINTSGDFSRAPIPPDIEEHFHTLLTRCKENGIDNLLFVNFPHRLTHQERYERYQYTNSVGDLIKSYGYDFINLESMTDEIGIIPETDFYDDEHMNLFGQYKTTRYLARILTEEYDIQGRELSPENKSHWDACTEYLPVLEAIFNYEYHTRAPDYDGLWMLEDYSFIQRLISAKENGGDPPTT